jgi:hypothetical protein
MKIGLFDLREFVSRCTYDKWGSKAIRFICPALLAVMFKLRDNLGRPITGNNWMYGGTLQWRGVRTPLYSGYSKTSLHSWGRALDFDVKGMTPRDVIKHILLHRINYPEITFIEIDINWVHIDVGIREGIYPNTDIKLWSPTRGFIEIDVYLSEV